MLVDEMRYPSVYEGLALQQFRQTYLRTQNALRANGVEFHRHYAATTACAPSCTSLFTGHYPSLHGVSQTNGAAKGVIEPDIFWLDPASVPTMGDYFRAGGYRTFYKGKWHLSVADMAIPGTYNQLLSYDDQGNPVPAKEKLYLDAERLEGYGFEGWIGPEPHGNAPLNTGSSPATGQGRDTGFATQAVNLIEQLDRQRHGGLWLAVASLVNPHESPCGATSRARQGCSTSTWRIFSRVSGSVQSGAVFANAQQQSEHQAVLPGELPGVVQHVDAGSATA